MAHTLNAESRSQMDGIAVMAITSLEEIAQCPGYEEDADILAIEFNGRYDTAVACLVVRDYTDADVPAMTALWDTVRKIIDLTLMVRAESAMEALKETV